jgi:DNA-directed RNA polymerase subunit RPC12/RpoP
VKQTALFPPEIAPSKPRKKREWMMHMIDAGSLDNNRNIAQFRCARCGHESDWMEGTVTEIKRGVPCPVCNRA